MAFPYSFAGEETGSEWIRERWLCGRRITIGKANHPSHPRHPGQAFPPPAPSSAAGARIRYVSDVDGLDSPPPMSRCARRSLGAAARTGDGHRALRCNALRNASIRLDPAPGAALQRIG